MGLLTAAPATEGDDDDPTRGRNGYESLVNGTGRTNPARARVTVERNYFYRANREGEAISNKASDNTYRYNSFVESQAAL